MARLKDATSVRQQAFNLLDDMVDISRQESVKILRDQFPNLSASYAMTLYQSHRQDRSKIAGGEHFVTVYKVRDIRSNGESDPYMSSMVIPSPSIHDARSTKSAVANYIAHNERKNKLAKELLK